MTSDKIITIIGSHAQEGLADIIDRKRGDIRANGFTMWFFRKNKYCNELVIKNSYEVYFCFPKTNNTAYSTKVNASVKDYSFDNILWNSIDNLNISSVTGNIVKNSICLTIEELIDAPSNMEVNISQYKNIDGASMKINQFFSTQVGIYDKTCNISSNTRKVAFIGKLYGSGFCYVR